MLKQWARGCSKTDALHFKSLQDGFFDLAFPKNPQNPRAEMWGMDKLCLSALTLAGNLKVEQGRPTLPESVTSAKHSG